MPKVVPNTSRVTGIMKTTKSRNGNDRTIVTYRSASPHTRRFSSGPPVRVR